MGCSVVCVVFCGAFFGSLAAYGSLYTQGPAHIEIEKPDGYQAYPGLDGSIVAFLAPPSSLTFSQLEAKYPSQFEADKDMKGAFQDGIKILLEKSGNKNVTVEAPEVFGTKKTTGLVFRYSYMNLKKEKMRGATILLEMNKDKTLSVDFRATDSSYDEDWKKILILLKQMDFS